jgi:hypothetical protein
MEEKRRARASKAAVSAIALTFVTILTMGCQGAAVSEPAAEAYDPRDFSGLWSRNPGQYGQPECPECRAGGPVPGYGFYGTPPARTPEGERRFQLNRPARGLELGSPEAAAAAAKGIDEGFRRAVLPAFGNDPQMRCEPLGLARLIGYAGGGPAMEMIQVADRIVQRFEWTWDSRDIWLDGRTLPNVEDYLPRFNGYSVGAWEGDTLVVRSTGFDDRQWLDQYGYPISDQAVLEERWDRPSRDRLRVRLTLIDPVLYTEPWQAADKVWALIPKDAMSVGGWSGIFEDRCVPSDESLFNTYRDHAAGLN